MLRLVSLPERTRLSIPIISHRGSRSQNQFARELPTKPQIPVMRSLIAGNDNALPLRVKQLFLTFSARVVPMSGPPRILQGAVSVFGAVGPLGSRPSGNGGIRQDVWPPRCIRSLCRRTVIGRAVEVL